MRNDPISRACFICGATSGDEVFSADIDVCGLGPIHYAIRCCAMCGLTLQDPAVSPETMLRQYSMFSNYTAFSAGDPPLSAPAHRMLQAVERLKPGRMYDVGAAVGAMAWHFRKQGWRVGGCDPSQLAVKQAADLYGLEIDIGIEEDSLPKHADLDLITFSHVLEHIYDPPATLARVHAALAPGGHLLFEVPCLTAPEINPPALFMMEHINYFCPRSITNMLTRAGFEIVAAPVTLDHFPFPVITVLARKTEPKPDAPLDNAHAANLEFCRIYAARDEGFWNQCDARLRATLKADEPVYVWGAGLHTSTLLARTTFSRHARILGVADRDPQKHGHTVGGYGVEPPSEAIGSARKIVLSSYVSEAQIAAGLIGQSVPEDRLVRLYT